MCFSRCIGLLTVSRLLALMGVAAGLIVSVALVGQYGFDLYPCHLCLYQRYPYVAIMLLALAACFRRAAPWHGRIAWLCVGLFVIDGGIAVYHAGVELGWFPGPSGCSNATTGEQTLEEMRRAIMQAPLVTCDQAMIHVLGLSMAAWNALVAFGVALKSAILLILINNRSPKARKA